MTLHPMGSKQSRAKHQRRWIIAGTLAIAVAGAIYGVRVHDRPPELFSSPTGLRLYDRAFDFVPPTELEAFRSPSQTPLLSVDEELRAHFFDDGEIQLIAAGLCLPGNEEFAYFDLHTLDPSDPPEGVSTVPIEPVDQPLLRLVFFWVGSVPLRAYVSGVFDSRTHFPVSKGARPAVDIIRPDERFVIDAPLDIWHDAAVVVGGWFERDRLPDSGTAELGLGLFPIEALPSMPNHRSIDNLFDAQIPKVVLGERYLLDVALNAVQLRTSDLGSENSHLRLPRARVGYPETYHDVTPRELLAVWEQYSGRKVFGVDQSTHEILLREPQRENWAVRAWNWIVETVFQSGR